MRKQLVIVVGIVAATGCGDPSTTPDALVFIDASPPDASEECPPPGGTHKIFLAFEGVTLQPGDTDALTDTWKLVTEPRTVPAWRATDPARDVAIAEVVCDARRMLRPFDIDLVVERPAAGPYTMIAIGGTSTDLGLPNGFQGLGETDCGRTRATDVAWVSQYWLGSATNPELMPREVGQLIAGNVGLFNGVDGSTTAGDCMCGWGNPCTLSPTELCTFGTASKVDPIVCTGTPTQDELAALIAVYGPRP